MLRIGPRTVVNPALVAASAVLASMFLSGCFQYSDVLTLRSDGSGTFVMDVKVDRASLQSVAGMSGAMGGGTTGDAATGDEAFELPTRAELEAALATGAPGVQLTEYREVSDEQKRGFHAEAAFGTLADLTQMHRTLADVETVGSDARVQFAYEKSPAGAWNFRRTMGSAESAQAMAMLPMLLGQSGEAGGDSSGVATPDDPLAKARQMQAALSQLMPGVGDLHMRFEVKLPGAVGQNNATLVHDQVALWEYDLAHLLAAAASGTLEMSAVVKP